MSDPADARPTPPPHRPSPASLDVSAIEALVRRLATRVRIQRAMHHATTAAVFAIMALMLVLVLYKTGWIDFAELKMAMGLCAALIMGGGLVGAAMRLDPIALAQQIDRSHGLHDRLSSALSFAAQAGSVTDEEERALYAAQIEEAHRHLSGVELRRAAPFERPADLLPLVFFLFAFGGLALLKAPDHARPLPPAPEITHQQILDTATLTIERDRLEQLKATLKDVDDPELKELLEEIDELLDQVENRELSEREFLERLDEIDEKLAQKQVDPTLEQVTEKLSEAVKELKKELTKEEKALLEEEPEVSQILDALEKGDMKTASKLLEKLAKKLEDPKNMTPEKLEKLAKLMEKFADKINPDDPKLKELAKKHEKVVEELMKKLEKQGGKLSKKDEERLKRAQEDLEKARQEAQKSGEEKEGGRELKQLQRETEELAEKMEEQGKKMQERQSGGEPGKSDQKPQPSQKQGEQQGGEQGQQGEKQGEQKSGEQGESGDKSQASQAARQAAKQMGEQGDKQQSDRARDEAKRQLDDMREALKRGNANREEGEDGGSGQDQKKGEQLKDFMRRAGKQGEQQQPGQQGESSDESGKQKGKQPGQQGEGEQGGDQQSGDPKKGQAGEGPKDGPPLDQAGKGEGDRNLGDETGMDNSTRVDVKVDGQQGSKGETKSEVIKGASEEGFASRQYKDVYGDYSEVVEEVMEKEKVPKGYRYYVKRYFQLIKPREQE